MTKERTSFLEIGKSRQEYLVIDTRLDGEIDWQSFFNFCIGTLDSSIVKFVAVQNQKDSQIYMFQQQSFDHRRFMELIVPELPAEFQLVSAGIINLNLNPQFDKDGLRVWGRIGSHSGSLAHIPAEKNPEVSLLLDPIISTRNIERILVPILTNANGKLKFDPRL
jgi:hypothetical protein